MAKKDPQSSLPPEVVEAIVAGNHGDPFAVFGLHRTPAGPVVRTWQPQAVAVTVVVPGTGSRRLRRVHPAGLFEALLPASWEPATYRLRLTGPDGHSALHHDPYRFPPCLSQLDLHLLAEGTHRQLYQKLGAHRLTLEGVDGVSFAVWAPNALRVSVVGDFNGWDGRRHVMRFHHGAGIWELFIPGLEAGTLYKYEIRSHNQGYTVLKSDPVGYFSQLRPGNASIVWDIEGYQWGDQAWMAERATRQKGDAPLSVYEVHAGSWRRKQGWQWLDYGELARTLVPYVKEMGFSHIELLPIAEHPYDGSWGYQVTGFFAPTSRFGPPEAFMAFVDACHQAGIGLILDWVPAHFPRDEHGLGFFDGTHLYEHADPRQGQHPDWGTFIFNYGRLEVRQFLLANALFWLEKYHIDGLRVDAVASMLYLDFSRQPGEWVPNRFGGRENLEAIAFLRAFNQEVHAAFPDVLTIAEESTSWPGVTAPVAGGGLGFDLKWNMGWMHDTLNYMGTDPVYRSFHQGTLTFSLLYAFSERFLLPFSHDEVVHLKKSMLDKMPGDVWQRFANLRALYAYQWAHPGKKMLFMGNEFGQWREWSETRELDWFLLQEEARHAGLQRLVAALNRLYREVPALHAADHSWQGFTWLDFHDAQQSVLAFMRLDPAGSEPILVVCNFTPIPRHDYLIGAPQAGIYMERLNTDRAEFGGSGLQNGPLPSQATPWNNQPHSLRLTLPPLAVLYLQRQGQEEAA